jgi:hypothetical protein
MGMQLERGENLEAEVAKSPRILHEVVYQSPNVAVFPSLQGVVKHGFSWGKDTRNMAYGWNPSTEPVKGVHGRITSFLADLNMNTPDNAYTTEARYKGEPPSIFDITSEIAEAAKPDSRGQFKGTDFLVTQLSDIPLVGKPGDCIFSVVQASDGKGEPVLGLLHTGRSELTHDFATTAVNHLRRVYDTDPASIRIGIAPGLGKKNHILEKDGIAERLEGTRLEETGWVPHTVYDSETDSYHLDTLGYLIAQLTDAGVLPENIEAYAIDTYEAAQKGETFSHRFATSTSQQWLNGRFMIAAQLE